MLKQQPGFFPAVEGLATANLRVRAAKATVDSGRTNSERLQTAVTRQTQALKEYSRADSDHTTLMEKVDASATRLAAVVASLAEAEETLTSIQVEGAGAHPAAPPMQLQVTTMFAVWNEVAARLGWQMGDMAAFDAMAATVFAQSTAAAAGAGPTGPLGAMANQPAGPAPAPAQAMPAAAKATAATPPAFFPKASGPAFFGPGSFGPSEARGMDTEQQWDPYPNPWGMGCSGAIPQLGTGAGPFWVFHTAKPAQQVSIPT
jgi:hypothetical protein